MSVFPDRNSDPKKEAILSRAPFTRAFLWSGCVEDMPTWQEKMMSASEPVEQELADKLGANWQKAAIAPLAIMTSATSVFEPTLPAEVQYMVVRSLVEIGFEIGDPRQAELLLPEIVRQFVQIDFFSAEALTRSQAMVVRTLTALLRAGAYLRTENFDRNFGVPDVFADFINSLPPDK